MDADRLARAEVIFQELMDIAATEQRDLLSRRCGNDTELEAFVARLLGHDSRELGSFLEPRAVPAELPEEIDDSFSPPSKIGHYEIIRRLGRGGMGVVYEALDTRLGRKVAVKVLPSRLAEDPDGLLRFQREARAVAALNHPNIVTLHSVEEAEGTHFLTMELVEGRRLTELIDPAGIPEKELLEIAIPVVEAIAYAHERGIVHRDLKPGNIMIAGDGQPKVLDFGIAKFLGVAEPRPGRSGSGDDALTAAGGVLGTSGYTSPEQLGGSEIDHRSDLFSFGIVLYELATGRRPFAGGSPAELGSAILDQLPPSVAELNPAVSEQLDRSITRCLEKVREARFESARELGDALSQTLFRIDAQGDPLREMAWRSSGLTRWRLVAASSLLLLIIFAGAFALRERGIGPWASSRSPFPGANGGASAERKRLAVLPFENLGQREDAHFAAGVSEEITSRLIAIGGLSVVSRTSAARFVDSSRSAAEIGAELDASYLLGGSVRTEELADGTREVLVTLRLTEVSSDTDLWTHRSSSKVAPGEMIQLQATVAEEVAGALDIALLEGERQAIRAEFTANAQAYEDFLLGRYHWHKRNPAGLELAASYFEDAVARDSNFARAYAGLADSYVLFPLYGVGGLGRREAYARAENAALRAIQLDKSLAEAHCSLAVARFYGSWDFEAAEPLFQTAIRLDPDYAVARYWYGELLSATGRIEAAIDQAEQAVATDPLLALGHHLLGVWLVAAGYDDEGERRLRRAAELEPDFPYVHSELGDLYFRVGRFDEAVVEWERFGIPRALGELVIAASRKASARAAALEAIEDFESSAAFPGHLGYVGMASLYALVGAPGQALDRLEAAFTERSEELLYLPTMARTDPGIQRLSDQPRYVKLLQEIGLD